MLTRRSLGLSASALVGVAALPVPSAARGAAASAIRLAVSCSYSFDGIRRDRTSKPFLVRLDSYGTAFDLPDAIPLPTAVSQTVMADGRSTPVRTHFEDVRLGVVDGVAGLRSVASGPSELVLRVRLIDMRKVVRFETPGGGSIALPNWDDRRLLFVVPVPTRDAPVEVSTGVEGFAMTVSLA